MTFEMSIDNIIKENKKNNSHRHIVTMYLFMAIMQHKELKNEF